MNLRSSSDHGLVRLRWGACSAAVLALHLIQGLVVGDEPQDPFASSAPAEGDQAAQQRFEFMRTALQRYELTVDGEAAPMEATPLLRWTNPQSNVKDGMLVAYSRGGRPDVLAQLAMYSPKTVMQEFQSTSEATVEMRRDGRLMWNPAGPVIEFRTLNGAAPPSERPALRTAQMRAIAGEFEIFDDFGWKETVRQTLRLLPRAIYRYEDPQANIIDGAIFTYVIGTDPECNLFLEADSTADGPRWRYAFRPMSIYKLDAFRGDELVWSCPESRVFGSSSNHHYSCPYPRHPEDASLEGLFPDPAAKPQAK